MRMENVGQSSVDWPVHLPSFRFCACMWVLCGLDSFDESAIFCSLRAVSIAAAAAVYAFRCLPYLVC